MSIAIDNNTGFAEAKPVVYALLLPITLLVVASFMPFIFNIHTGVIVAGLSFLATFFCLNAVQERIVSMPHDVGLRWIRTPLLIFVGVWSIALLVADKTQSFIAIMPAFALSVIPGLWPLLNRSEEGTPKPRRLSYLSTFWIGFLAYMVLVASGVPSW